MRQAACVAGAWVASSALPVVAAGEVQRHPRSLLVDSTGSPWLARQLKQGQAFLFNYPYTVSPVFLLALEREQEHRRHRVRVIEEKRLALFELARQPRAAA